MKLGDWMRPRPVVRLAAGLLCVVLLSVSGWAAEPPHVDELRIFDGKPKLIVVNGYSTSRDWPDVLRRKLKRYANGSSPIEVVEVIRGSTPIAKWIDVKTGEPLERWRYVRAALDERGERPAIVLAQQSLQWVFGSRPEGIRSEQDTARIRQGADALQKYAELLRKDGAALVLIAVHIYKPLMEPEIGNERLALAELSKRAIPGVYAGPDVWNPTRKQYPRAYADDEKHPNAMGAEIMAQAWFEALLLREGLEVPEWSKQELAATIAGKAD